MTIINRCSIDYDFLTGLKKFLILFTIFLKSCLVDLKKSLINSEKILETLRSNFKNILEQVSREKQIT